jgi:hypothetical protein
VLEIFQVAATFFFMRESIGFIGARYWGISLDTRPAVGAGTSYYQSKGSMTTQFSQGHGLPYLTHAYKK